MNKQLTKAEEQIMKVIWSLELCSVKEVLKKFPEPKPAYNTVSTIIRILETKKFLGHEQQGKGYKYFPLVEKDSYKNQSLTKMVDTYFEGSFKSLVSFFVSKNDMDIEQIDDVLKEIQKLKDHD